MEHHVCYSLKLCHNSAERGKNSNDSSRIPLAAPEQRNHYVTEVLAVPVQEVIRLLHVLVHPQLQRLQGGSRTSKVNVLDFCTGIGMLLV